ncbi:hypothetical protein GQ55_6G186700 [Panicum hallii var. hallii]|uniref:Uncharacterized protein n=1 Tax=Panicum hallii var. hallii TaxID=1504633 RepID=A0A2T7D788_9POAL|nr:hypothetical protein GQ55_6G186700 [Panicum hallii var. hallii]
MGDVGAAAAPPQARAPAPPPRRDAGPATPPDGGRELEVLAGAGLCCFLGALLLCNVASAALMATRRVFGRDSGAAAAAAETFVVAAGYLLYLAILALVGHLVNRRHKGEAREALVGGARDATRPAKRRPLAESIRARGRQEDALYGPVTGGIYLASCVLMVVGFLMLMLAPARSYPERAGYVVAEIGWFLHSAAFCFIICPALSVQWRSTYAKLKED